MLAVSFYGLLAPAAEFAESDGSYAGFEFVPVSVGIAVGAAFVYFVDVLMPNGPVSLLAEEKSDCDNVAKRASQASQGGTVSILHDATGALKGSHRGSNAAVEDVPFDLSSSLVASPSARLVDLVQRERSRMDLVCDDASDGDGASSDNDGQDGNSEPTDAAAARRRRKNRTVSKKPVAKRARSDPVDTKPRKDDALALEDVELSRENRTQQLLEMFATGVKVDTNSMNKAVAVSMAAAGNKSDNGDVSDKLTLLEEQVAANERRVAAAKREKEQQRARSRRRMMLLIFAVTLHNFPEGLAVGLSFASINTGGDGASELSTFDSAKTLAVGMAIQNIPEGLAVSLPLLRIGYSPLKAFFYGQLSGLVEPLGGILGAAINETSVMVYALAFAAGAMLYVVCDDMIPEMHSNGNGRVASVSFIIGFIGMMILDTADIV
jgi:zinc transporter ZupT